MPEGAEVVDEESVEEDVVKVVKEAGAEVVDEESVEEDVVKVVKEAGAEVVDEESVEEDVVKVVKEAGVDLGVTAKYATAPARTIITITISAVTVRDMARDEIAAQAFDAQDLRQHTVLYYLYVANELASPVLSQHCVCPGNLQGGNRKKDRKNRRSKVTHQS